MLLAAVVALVAGAEPRTFDWPAVTAEFPKLGQFSPVSSDAALRELAKEGLYLRLGGKCRRLAFDTRGAAKLDLGTGMSKGHTWRWSLEVHLGPKTSIEGPIAVHGLDRVGDGRVFRDAPPKRWLGAGPIEQDELALFSETHAVEVACWGIDEASVVCEGKKQICKRCTVLRLMGAPRGGQRVYGDGVVRADLTRGCDAPCVGPGLVWSDFEALAAAVKRTPVVDPKGEKAARLFRRAGACEAANADLDPAFTGGEPAIPAR